MSGRGSALEGAEVRGASAAVLDVRGLRKSYGGVVALADFSLGLQPSTVTGLVGPNGSGKSTVIEVISGRRLADAGSTQIRGRDVTRWSTARRARAGLVRTFQTPRVWRGLSVGENLLAASPAVGRDSLWRTFLAPRALGQTEQTDRGRAEEILRAFDLWNLRNDLAGTLSGGQARLLELGRIVMARAIIALLDEPLSGVNPVMSQQVMAAVERIRDGGVAVLLVEHHMEILRRLCPNVIGMVAGKIVADGPLNSILEHDAFLEAYLGASVSGGSGNG